MDQKKFDLNLLVVFDALMRERHVRRAGERVGLTQPAVSHALARLRDLVDDPLFVRHARGVRPTPRAEELAASIGPALSVLQTSVISRPSFDPSKVSRLLVVGSSDYADLTVVPQLAARLLHDAPGVDLRIRSVSRKTVLQDLRRRDVDLAIGPLSAAPDDLDMVPLFVERFVFVARVNHPLLSGSLTPQQFADFPQLLVSPGGDAAGMIDQVLRESGLTRRVALTIPHFLAAPFIVEKTDLISVVPERVALRMQSAARIGVRDLPLVVPDWTVGMVTTPSSVRDPFIDWIIELVQSAAEK